MIQRRLESRSEVTHAEINEQKQAGDGSHLLRIGPSEKPPFGIAGKVQH
jgi:hypothetical protein